MGNRFPANWFAVAGLADAVADTGTGAEGTEGVANAVSGEPAKEVAVAGTPVAAGKKEAAAGSGASSMGGARVDIESNAEPTLFPGREIPCKDCTKPTLGTRQNRRERAIRTST
jgi:hypothetical protein